MLYARANREYVNDEEIAKKIAFERTISFVNRLYPDEQKEVSLKPQKILDNFSTVTIRYFNLLGRQLRV